MNDVNASTTSLNLIIFKWLGIKQYDEVKS